MLTNHTILALAWSFYCFLHSLLASGRVKDRARRILGNNYRYYRFSYTIFSFIGLIALLAYQFSFSSFLLFQTSLISMITGFLIALVGLSGMALMIRKYFMQLSGVRWLTGENVPSRLEVAGLHKYVRHPLYLGTFIFIWGLFVAYPYLSNLIADVIITVYTLVALQFEEKKLLLEFGKEYEEYRKKVPMLIPKMRSEVGGRRTEEHEGRKAL